MAKTKKDRKTKAVEKLLKEIEKTENIIGIVKTYILLKSVT